MAEKKKTSTKEESVEIKEQTFSLEEKQALENQLAETKKLADDYKDKWVRNVAEFDNYKKRNANVWQEAYADGSADTIIKLLPIGDNLDYALSIQLDEKTHEGLVNIKKKYDETLVNMGVTEINPVGETFDPTIAEAVMQVEGAEGQASDTVSQVFQKGYKLKNKIIRYAKVSVVK